MPAAFSPTGQLAVLMMRKSTDRSCHACPAVSVATTGSVSEGAAFASISACNLPPTFATLASSGSSGLSERLIGMSVHAIAAVLSGQIRRVAIDRAGLGTHPPRFPRVCPSSPI